MHVDRIGGAGSSARSRLRMATAVVAVSVGVLALPVAALAAGDANTSGCAASTESSPGFRSYLPDCRAYELASPPYKEGGTLLFGPAAVSASGEDLIVGIAGAIGGVENLPFEPNRMSDIGIYRLQRTEAGWRYIALTPPAAQYDHSALLALSADPSLSKALWGAQTGRTFYHQEDIYMQGPDGALARVGPGKAPEVAGKELEAKEELSLAGASSDLTRSVFSITSEVGTVGGNFDLWPGDTTQSKAQSLYEYTYDGTERVEPLLVGVTNEGPLASNKEAHLISDCGTELGGSGALRSGYNAVSEDGETIFFTAGACGGSPLVNELYARIEASSTVAISEPVLPAGECSTGEPCFGAEHKGGVFQGASQDGGRVFFLSEQPLVNGAPAEGVKLYEARLKGARVAEVVDVSADATLGQSPGVQGVVRVSENGERVYFMATSKLAPKNAEEKEPEEGADNLYVYDTVSGGTTFVATLLTKTEETALEGEETAEKSVVEARELHAAFAAGEEALSKGASPEEAFTKETEAFQNAELTLPGTLGPSGTLGEDRRVWSTSDERPAQATPDGRFLVFPSSADLTEGDTSKVPQLFEYDAVARKLTRVSIGQGGRASGNVSTFHDAPTIPGQGFSGVDLPTAARFHLAVSDDGSRVFFTSAAPLTPAAVSGAPSVFEYREGGLYLLSDGKDTSDTGRGTSTVEVLGADPSGGDVFFTTASRLVPQAGDTQQALYDAREEGGFPALALTSGCMGETCQGPSAVLAGLPSPGSVTQGAGDNLTPPISKLPSKPLTNAQKLAKALKACRAKHNRRKRAVCESQARKRYRSKAKSTSHKAGK